MTADVEAEVDDEGLIRSWTYDVWGQGHTARPGYAGVPGLLAAAHLDRPLPHPGATDPPLVAGGGTARNAVPAYDVGPRRVTAHRVLARPCGPRRCVPWGPTSTSSPSRASSTSSREPPAATPWPTGSTHLSDPRAGPSSRWRPDRGLGRPLADGVGLGIGFARYKGTGAYCAVVAEVEAETSVRVRRLTVAVDVGLVLNPDGVRNQIEGGAVQATSWTLKERVRFDRTRVTSDDWETYPVLRSPRSRPSRSCWWTGPTSRRSARARPPRGRPQPPGERARRGPGCAGARPAAHRGGRGGRHRRAGRMTRTTHPPTKEKHMAQQAIGYVPLEEMDERMQEEMHRCAREGTPRPESSAVRAHVPAAFWAFADSWKALFHSGVCDHSIKELCRVYISRTVKCEFCGNQRSTKATNAGLQEQQYDDLLNFESSDRYDDRQKAALPTPRPSPGARATSTRSGPGCTRTSPRRSWSSWATASR